MYDGIKFWEDMEWLQPSHTADWEWKTVPMLGKMNWLFLRKSKIYALYIIHESQIHHSEQNESQTLKTVFCLTPLIWSLEEILQK
jgi:hypothetical protein